MSIAKAFLNCHVQQLNHSQKESESQVGRAQVNGSILVWFKDMPFEFQDVQDLSLPVMEESLYCLVDAHKFF